MDFVVSVTISIFAFKLAKQIIALCCNVISPLMSLQEKRIHIGAGFLLMRIGSCRSHQIPATVFCNDAALFISLSTIVVKAWLFFLMELSRCSLMFFLNGPTLMTGSVTQRYPRILNLVFSFQERSRLMGVDSVMMMLVRNGCTSIESVFPTLLSISVASTVNGRMQTSSRPVELMVISAVLVSVRAIRSFFDF